MKDVIEGIVEACSTKIMGIKLKEQEYWHNYHKDAPEADKEENRKKLENIWKGDKVRLLLDENDNKIYVGVNMIEKAKKDAKDMVSFDELLKTFKKEYPDFEKRTELIEHDWSNTRAVVKVQLTITEHPNNLDSNIRIIDALGDASITSLKNQPAIQPHFIRMAETRAFARSMRFALGERLVKEETDEFSTADNYKKPKEEIVE